MIKKELSRMCFAVGLILLCYQGYAQKENNVEVVDSHSPATFYSELSMGIVSPIYRDLATSPLFYRGVGIAGMASWSMHSDKKEWHIKADATFGTLSGQISGSDLINLNGSATLFNINFFYQYLLKINSLSNAKNNIKIGGTAVTSQNIRTNLSLFNNALGLENISNIMVSSQLTRDISRIEPKQLNFLLFKPTLKPVKRDLKFQLNIGLLNFNYRPGYAYAYDSEIIGLETDLLSWAFANYKWSMNGWRLNTRIEYIRYLPNGNARSLAYIWDAMHAPGNFESFQMASHRIQYTLYFHNKKR